MSEKIKEVYAVDPDSHELIEIQPEYVYITIPADYICIYHKLLTYFADYGLEMLDDCNACCKSKHQALSKCYDMFISAIAARQLGNHKLADTLIKYIEGQLNIKYDGNAPCPEVVYPITPDGKVKAMVGCGNKPKFYVDLENGQLYAKYLEDKDINRTYAIKDNQLIINNNQEDDSSD